MFNAKPIEEEKAEYLYLHTDLNYNEIAETLDVNRKTIYRWIREGNWKRAKYVVKHAPSVLAEQYYNQLGEMNFMIAARKDRPYPTKEEAEIMRKLSLSMNNVRGSRTTISQTMEVFCDFACELELKDHVVAQSFIGHMDDYIKMRSKEAKSLDNAYQSYLKDKREDQEFEEWNSVQPPPREKRKPTPPLVDDEEDTTTPESHSINDSIPQSEVHDITPPLLFLGGVGGGCSGLKPMKVTLPDNEKDKNQNPQQNNPNSSHCEERSNQLQLRGTKQPNSEKEDGTSDGTLPPSITPPISLVNNTVAENDNTDLSTIEFLKRDNGTQEVQLQQPGETEPGEQQKEVPALFSTDHYSQYLEEKYKISQDPDVIRRKGITIVRSASPLWGKDSSLFFPD